MNFVHAILIQDFGVGFDTRIVRDCSSRNQHVNSSGRGVLRIVLGLNLHAPANLLAQKTLICHDTQKRSFVGVP